MKGSELTMKCAPMFSVFSSLQVESSIQLKIRKFIYRAMENESNPEVEAAFAEIKELEKEIALADYELRTFLNRHSFLPSVRKH